MKITTYHDHDVGSFLHAGALAFTDTPELTPQPTAGADVVMQSRKNRESGQRAKGKDGGLGSEAVWVEKRVSPLRGSRKAVSRFGRNDGVFVVEKKGIRVAALPSEMRGFFAALRMTT